MWQLCHFKCKIIKLEARFVMVVAGPSQKQQEQDGLVIGFNHG